MMYFIQFIFNIVYRYTVIKHNNLPINAVFFASFLFNNIIGLFINSFILLFDLSPLPKIVYLILLLIIMFVLHSYFLKGGRSKNIDKRYPTKRDIIILDIILFSSSILFFWTLILIIKANR